MSIAGRSEEPGRCARAIASSIMRSPRSNSGPNSGATDAPPGAALLQRLGRKAAIVETQQAALALDGGLEHAFAAPQAVQVGQRFLGVLQMEVAAVVIMLHVQGAVLAEVG